MRSAAGRMRRGEVERVPAAGEVHRDLALLRRRRPARAQRQLRLDGGEEGLRREAGEVLDDAVVGQDAHLLVGEGDRQHGVGLPRAAALAAEGRPRPRGARRAVVAVGDVEGGDAAEGRGEVGGVLAADPPERVRHPVLGGEVVERRRRGDPPRDGVDRGGGAVGQEHDPGLRRELDHVPRAVVLLVAPGVLVLLDQALVVLVERVAGGEADLLVAAVAETIEVEARLGLDEERRRPPELRQVCRRPRVDLVPVGVGAGGQVDLGPGDVQEAQRVACRQRPRLLRAHHVVGDGRDARGRRGHRPQRPERSDRSHGRILAGSAPAVTPRVRSSSMPRTR